ncbi:hypothetical protein A9Q98_05460 [Thalassotalea sp. 42_200_T64]|nr:hypothetical protein A9Q98_05460 [Thalassotalea sp. 42_200_T64]
MNKHTTNGKDWQTTTAKNTVHLLGWTLSWVLTIALSAFGPKFLWDFNTVLSIIAVLLNIGVGIGMILANRKHLKGLDEMMQQIQLNAMALSLGVGLVFGISYEQLEDIKLITFEPEITHLIMLMTAAYMTGIVLGHRKYK